MKRADRRDDSSDNSIRNPRSQRSEPVSAHEHSALVMTLRSQRDEAAQKAREKQQQAEQTQNST